MQIDVRCETSVGPDQVGILIMVRKVTGSSPTRPGQATIGVNSNRAVEGATVDKVGQVGSLGQSAGVDKVRRPTRPLTSEEREHLFQLVNEEAEKLFGANGLPEKKKKVVTESVKMAIAAGATVEEEEG